MEAVKASQETAAKAWTAIGQTTPQLLAGRELQDEATLRLTQAPCLGFRRELDNGDVQYAVVIANSIGRRALMDLLYAMAPYKAHGPDRFARVLDNWGIFDRAAVNGASDGLLQQHVRSLKVSWQVFAEHRDLFMTIFRDQSEATRTIPVLTWDKTPAGVQTWRLDEIDPALTQALGEAAPEVLSGAVASRLDALVGLVTVPYFLPHLLKKWPAWKPLAKGGKSNYIGPASVPVMALLHRRALMNSAFVANAEAWIDDVAGSTSDGLQR